MASETSSLGAPLSDDAASSLLSQLLLPSDVGVKVGGIDVDGILRGKVMSIAKFRSAVKNGGFGFCSVAFGWDMHDRTYLTDTVVSSTANGFADLNAVVDTAKAYRLPWDNDRLFFLLNFTTSSSSSSGSGDGCGDGDGASVGGKQVPLAVDPRNVLARQAERASRLGGWSCMAGLEYEFFNYAETPASLAGKAGRGLTPLTPGNFGYSLQRLGAKDNNAAAYFDDIYHTCLAMGVVLEGWHTETGPGVYEAALEFGEVRQMADKGSMFKFICKSIGLKHGVVPCFMAKPHAGMSGNSGHIHISLADADGTNLFYRSDAPSADSDSAQTGIGRDADPENYPDLQHFSDLGIHFTAGVLEALPSVMPLLAPTINSYKRLVENYWAPTAVSWGFEHRLASVRLIAPPSCPPKATRIEVRVPGADTVPHLALAALLGAGLRGVEKKLKMPVPPLSADAGPSTDPGADAQQSQSQSQAAKTRLPKDLKAATLLFAAKDSIAREIFGDTFVDHYAATRMHECRLWEEAVTEWEVARYIETV